MRRMVSMSSSYPTTRWATLVRATAVVSAVIEIVRGVAVPDRESIAIGVLMVVFTAVSYSRRATIGRVGVALLFVNQAFWMMSATWTLTHAAPSLVGAAIPSVLAVGS